MLYLSAREHPRGPQALLKDLQPALLSHCSGQKGGYKPLLCRGLRLAPHSCFRQAEVPGFHSLRCLRSSACFEIPSPTSPTEVWSYWEIPVLAHPCHHNAKLTSGNLQQWKILLQVCEGMGANAAGEKGAAPEEGLGGFSLACQPDLLLPPPKSLGASSSGCQEHGHQPSGTERGRDLLGARQV